MRSEGLTTFAVGVVALAFGAAGLSATATAQIEEIVVTAQKREQSLQDVPIAVAAYTEELLLNSGVDDIQELMNLSPSFQASSNVSETQGLVIRIRGIGTQGNNPAFESAVGVFIDGVYRARAGIALTELQDVERIEVLRGPQGTLFGRNTSAGALNIVTRGPSFESEGSAEVSYGNFDQFDIRGSISGPLVEDRLAVRVGAQFQSRDGIIEDLLTGERYDDKQRYRLKGQLLFTPTENADLRIIFDGRESNEECCFPVTFAKRAGVASNIINFLLTPGTQIDPPAPFNRQATKTPGRPLTQDVSEWGLSAELNVEFDSFTFSSVTAYRDFESFRQLDIDFTDADLINQSRVDVNQIFTQEFRVQGVWNRLDWLVGVFYSDETIKFDSTLTHGAQYEDFINARLGPLVAGVFGPTLLGPAGLPLNYTGLAQAFGVTPGFGWADGTGAIGDEFRSDNQSFSVFTHNVFNITEDLQAIVGFRYNIDDKRGRSNLNNDPANTPGCSAIQPALQSLPNILTLDSVFGNGDQRRIKDVLAVLGCLGIASPAFSFDLDQDVDEWNGVFGLSYNVNEDVMVYGNFSRGYKAGGINLDRAGTILSLVGDNTDPNNFLDPRFLPETVNAFEVGVKSSWLSNRLRANLALFWQNLDDFQLNTFTGFNFTPENVETAKSRGFELDVTAAPTEGLQFQGGVAYTKADYGDNITDLTNRLTNERGLRDLVTPIGTITGTPLPELSPLAGQQLTNAPRWVLTGAITYGRPISATGQIEMFVHGDFRWSSSYNTGSDLDPEKLQESFAIFNARGGFRSADGNWQVDIWAKNVFEKDYQQVAFDIPLQANDAFGAFLADPRTWGVSVRARY
ncbi:MAG: TonB-dependent receptor [Sphingomonadales bacterium]